MLGGFLRLAHAARLDHAPAEHVDRAGHGAEFIAALAAGDRDVDLAAGKAVHDRRDRGQWARQAATEQQCQRDCAKQDGDRAEDQAALRARRGRFVFGRILDDFENADRLAGVVLDLPEIERGGPAADRGVPAQRLAVEHALQLTGGRDHFVAEGRGQLLEVLAVERMDRKVDAEALLGAIDEFLAEGGADVDRRHALSVAHDRRYAENAERLPAGLDANDLPAGFVRLNHGAAACRDIFTEDFWRVEPVDHHGRWLLEGDQRDALCRQCLHGIAEQRCQSVPVLSGNSVGDRRQRGDHRTDRQRGAPFIVDGGDHTVILQLELLIERELRQRALLGDREGSENAAGDGHRQRNGEDQPNGDRANFEHEKYGSSRRRRASEAR